MRRKRQTRNRSRVSRQGSGSEKRAKRSTSLNFLRACAKSSPASAPAQSDPHLCQHYRTALGRSGRCSQSGPGANDSTLGHHPVSPKRCALDCRYAGCCVSTGDGPRSRDPRSPSSATRSIPVQASVRRIRGWPNLQLSTLPASGGDLTLGVSIPPPWQKRRRSWISTFINSQL